MKNVRKSIFRDYPHLQDQIDDLLRNQTPELLAALLKLCQGGVEEVITEYAPKALVRYKVQGTEVPLYKYNDPETDGAVMVPIKKTIRKLPPDLKAISDFLNRAMGKPIDQAPLEVKEEDVELILDMGKEIQKEQHQLDEAKNNELAVKNDDEFEMEIK